MPPNQRRRNQPDPNEIQPDRKKILVVHGRNKEAKRALVKFLRLLHLDPQEWEQLIQKTRNGSPYIGSILDAGFASTQAAVVLLTPDDEVRLRRNLLDPEDSSFERQGSYQPRPNVFIEAGMALGIYHERTIFVRIGKIRPISDIDGRDVINFTGDIASRTALVERLRTIECEVFTDESTYNEKIDLPITEPDIGESVIANSYLDLLRFAKLIHHNFQELDTQGFQKMGTAVKALFLSQSEGDRPVLIKTCETGWVDSQDTQNNIQKNILDKQEELIRRVNGDDGGGFNHLWTTENNTSSRIMSSHENFVLIKEYLSQYLNYIAAVSTCFDSDDNLNIVTLTSFINDARNLTKIVGSLINNSDEMIKNVISALEVDSRLWLEQRT